MSLSFSNVPATLKLTAATYCHPPDWTVTHVFQVVPYEHLKFFLPLSCRFAISVTFCHYLVFFNGVHLLWSSQVFSPSSSDNFLKETMVPLNRLSQHPCFTAWLSEAPSKPLRIVNVTLLRKCWKCHPLQHIRQKKTVIYKAMYKELFFFELIK